MAWEKGKSGNPKGRPVGARTKLTESFFRKLQQDWKEHGISAIEKVREEQPAVYLKMIADLVPKDVRGTVDHKHTHERVSGLDGILDQLFSEGKGKLSEGTGEDGPILSH